MKTVLLTGITGFVGRHVLNYLLNCDVKIIAAGRDINKLAGLSESNRIETLKFDVYDYNENWFELTGRPDILIHMAWGGLPDYKKLSHIEKELPAHMIFLKSMISSGLKNLTVTGTCFEYGMRDGVVNEEMPAAPVTCYGIAKDTLRKYLEQLGREYELSLKWLRYFYMYGEGQNPKSLMPQLETAIKRNDKIFNMSGGEQLRDFLPVDKVAEYTVKTALQNDVTGIINVCSGKPYSVRNLIEKKIRETNSDIKLNLGFYPYPDYEPMAFWGDNKKLLRVL